MKDSSKSSYFLFEDIYATYYKKVLTFIKSMIGNYSAEDITQDVFIKIFTNIESLKDKSSLTSWIYKISLNTAIDKLRKDTKINAVNIGANKEDHRIEDFYDKNIRSQEEEIINKEMIECYMKFVKKLPKIYLEVYFLSDLKDFSNNEISKRLSISIETVKIRLHRARALLFKELREQCQCYYNGCGELLGELKN